MQAPSHYSRRAAISQYRSAAGSSKREPRPLGRYLWASLFAASIAFVPSLSTAQAYFMGLGETAAGGTWFIDDISADGSTVVGGKAPVGQELVRWNEVDGIFETGVATVDARHPQRSLATSTNGTVVVGSVDVGSQFEAFVWDEITGVTLLGTLPGGEGDSFASGVSGDGAIVAGNSSTAAGRVGFVWDATNGMQSIGELPGGVYGSLVNAISADGSTIVGFSKSVNGQEAFIWDETNGMQGLGFIQFSGGRTEALAVSDDGSVVVGMTGSTLGFIWDAVEGIRPLGGPWEGWNPIPLDISGDGSIVVGYMSTSTRRKAFIWDAQNGGRVLRDELAAMGAPVAGWKFEFAKGISSDGTRITGFGENPEGAEEGFLVLLPEPGFGQLIAFGSLGTAWLFRVRRPFGLT